VLPDCFVDEERRVALALVVVERAQELDRERAGVVLVEEGEILGEVRELGLGGRRDEVRDRPELGEVEVGDPLLQGRWQRPHAPDPLVLERMVLGRGEHVEAEHRFEQRRVGERDAVVCVARNGEADGH